MKFEMLDGEPLIVMMEMMQAGMKFEVCDCPKTEKKWYYNENGEYVRED